VKSDSWIAQPLQHKQPISKIWINDDILPAKLQKETCMSYKRDAKLSIGNKSRLVTLSRTRGDGGMPHKAAKLFRALAQCRITEICLQQT
jgi:hypothetical protein